MCVCGSDLWAYRDTFKREPRSRLGHEFIGTVEEVGSAVSTLRQGDFAMHRRDAIKVALVP